jgi:predicted LPLAT superfamily acyltransferase
LLVRQDADDWASVKTALKKHYATRRSDFYVCAMFNVRQAKHETAAAWCSRLDQFSSDFRGAAIEGATSSKMCGITKLVSQLGKACFIQGLANERIQTVVRASVTVQTRYISPWAAWFPLVFSEGLLVYWRDRFTCSSML